MPSSFETVTEASVLLVTSTDLSLLFVCTELPSAPLDKLISVFDTVVTSTLTLELMVDPSAPSLTFTVIAKADDPPIDRVALSLTSILPTVPEILISTLDVESIVILSTLP